MLLKCVYRALLALSCVFATTALTGCKQEIQFTRVPVSGANERDTRPNETTIFLAVPVDLTEVVAAADRAIASQIARSREFIDDIACDRRKGPWIECMGATVTTDLERAGAIELGADGSALLLTIPVRYEINAKGHGWASYLSDRKTGIVKVGVPFEVLLTNGYRLDTRIGQELIWSDKSVPILKGKLVFGRMADGKIKAQLKSAADPLRKAVGDQPIKEATEKAWRALHAPIELTRSPSLWLRGLPERVIGAGFARQGQDIVYRVAIDARVGVHRGERPQALFVKALPEPSRTSPLQAAGKPSNTILRLPVEIGAKSLQQAVATAFSKSDVIETRADAKTAPVKVRPTSTTLFPARDRVALELQLDVVEPVRLFGMTGKAYLLGRPVFTAETGVLELQDVAFPPVPPRDAKLRDGLVRIGEEPFAGRFATAARLNIGSEVRELLPRVNELIAQRLDDKMQLTGKFDSLEVTSVDAVRDGFRLNVELIGNLILKYGIAVVGSAQMQPTSGQANAKLSGTTN